MKLIKLSSSNKWKCIAKLFCTNAERDVISIFDDLCHVQVQVAFRAEKLRILPDFGVVENRVDVNHYYTPLLMHEWVKL